MLVICGGFVYYYKKYSKGRKKKISEGDHHRHPEDNEFPQLEANMAYEGVQSLSLSDGTTSTQPIAPAINEAESVTYETMSPVYDDII